MNLYLLLTLAFVSMTKAEGSTKTKIYLIPGQGSDSRIYSNIQFPDNFETVHIKYELPAEGETMKSYAKKMAKQIPEEEGFIIIGVSLGGMIATEIAEIKSPNKVILISSAKNATELPARYNFQKNIPLYKMVGPKLSKSGAQFLQPIVEPDSKNEAATFQAMMEDKDPVFLKRTIQMIIEWDKQSNSCDIIHIHGNKDKTIPIKHVDYDYLVENGSHMMTLTRGDELSEILCEILE